MEFTKKWPLYEVIRVLVVDHDSTTLKSVSQMLGTCGYEVVTANCAIDALRIVREREHDLHLVLTEVNLPDMGRYELLEKIMELKSKLPIVIMSSDDNEIAKMGCLFKGAMLYLVKPLTSRSVRNLWQFSFIKWRRRERPASTIRSSNRAQNEPIIANELDEKKKARLLIRNEKKNWQKMSKRKDKEVASREVEGDDGIDPTLLKRPKLIWTEQLHTRFLQAIKVLGVDKAHPKEILQHMNVPGLRKEKVSSHLQKYRLSLKRAEDVIQKKISETSNPNQRLGRTNSPSLSHFGRQVPTNNIGVFMAKKPPFGRETQPQQPTNNNNLASTSINSNLLGSGDVVSFESPTTNRNMDNNSCFSKEIPNLTCSGSSTQPRGSLEDHQNWFECEKEGMATMSTMHLQSQVEDEHCIFKLDHEGLDEIFDIVKDFSITLQEEDYYDDLWQ